MAKNTTSNPKAKKVRALWSKLSFTTIFCDLFMEEIEAGNGKKGASFSLGWNNLVSKFYDVTGKNYDKDKLKKKKKKGGIC